jgi:hypothetical protein
MLEGSTRSREVDAAGGKARDVVEAGLNEAAVNARSMGVECGQSVYDETLQSDGCD